MGGGFSDFLVERFDATALVHLDDAEVARLSLRHGDGGDGEIGLVLEVAREHLEHVHFVDVVPAEDADVLGRLVGDDVLRLVDRVGRAAKPALSGALLRGDRLDEVVEHRREAPRARDVLFERRALVLREDLDPMQPRVDEIRENDVDDSIAPTEGNRGLGAVDRERAEAPPLAAGEDHHEHAARLEERSGTELVHGQAPSVPDREEAGERAASVASPPTMPTGPGWAPTSFPFSAGAVGPPKGARGPKDIGVSLYWLLQGVLALLAPHPEGFAEAPQGRLGQLSQEIR